MNVRRYNWPVTLTTVCRTCHHFAQNFCETRAKFLEATSKKKLGHCVSGNSVLDFIVMKALENYFIYKIHLMTMRKLQISS